MNARIALVILVDTWSPTDGVKDESAEDEACQELLASSIAKTDATLATRMATEKVGSAS